MNTPLQDKNTLSHENEEVDLIDLAKKMWTGRKIIIRFTLGGIILGLIIAIFSPKEYIATTTMVPQTKDSNASKLGGLSSLAAMAGFNMNNMESPATLSPMLYPQIVNSVPFQHDLLNASYTIEGSSEPVNLFTYYTEIKKLGLFPLIKRYTIGLPSIILRAFKGKQDSTNGIRSSNNLLKLTEEQERIRKKLSEQINIEINDKEGYITLSSRFNKAELAAQVTQKSQQLLQQYITDFKIEKASEKLHFIEERYAEKKAEFEQAQKNLATFRDRNKNVSSAMALTEEERLQSEYQLAYSVYSELAKQLEQAKIQVKEETPVFAIIQPVQIPVDKSKPNRPLILFVWMFLGGIMGVFTVFGRQFIVNVKHRWKKE
ncbi:Wzz/FepE/Etk N-terminal domain-containing protein [Sunxiuqinia sp. A32]|uniref:Wzz/FepE/Etk N-terminal domain-containing protein n=1 Tax=Sunxiuqinia sp. A32 TaxID=3461496 RepID=UPI0040462759